MVGPHRGREARHLDWRSCGSSGIHCGRRSRVGVGLTQIGEFSFILVQVAHAAGQVGDEVYSATLAASLLTILINALLVRYVPA